MSDILISIKPKYADLILAGTKQVELRKRSAKIAPGTRLLIYSTSPRKALVGEACVSFAERLPLDELFARYGAIAHVTRDEFRAYYSNDVDGVALGLAFVMRYADPLGMERLRDLDHGFRPPQSYMRASPAIKSIALSQRRCARADAFGGDDTTALYP
jgi:predicted transcriptional regulator